MFRFVNDTPHWLLVRTFVGSSSLVVNLYGSPIHRRVVSQTRPLVETGPVPVKRVPDPTLFTGVTQIEEYGQPPRSTSVRRLVYTANDSGDAASNRSTISFASCGCSRMSL